MTVSTTIADLAPVKQTRDQASHILFRFILILLVLLALVYYLAQEGFLMMAYEWIGGFFAAMFAAVLLWGIYTSITQTVWCALAMNRIKNGGANRATVAELFRDENVHQQPVEVIEGLVNDSLLQRIESISYAARIAARVGYFGTVYGILIALGALTNKQINGSQDVLEELPVMLSGLSLAFGTTLVGIAIGAMLDYLYRVNNANMNRLRRRVLRIVYQEQQS